MGKKRLCAALIATRDGAEPRENLSTCKHISTVACGLLAVWALTNTSPVIAANQVNIIFCSSLYHRETFNYLEYIDIIKFTVVIHQL